MSPNDKTCPDCGQNHSAYSEEMKALFERYQAETDPNEREALLIVLANLFIEQEDPSDLHLSEDVQELINAAEEKHMAYHNSILRVGRVVARSLQYILQKEALLHRVAGKASPPPPSKPPSTAN